MYVPKNPHEKAMQRALMQYRNPANYDLVKEALHIAGREDLIGLARNALLNPDSLNMRKTMVETAEKVTESLRIHVRMRQVRIFQAKITVEEKIQ